MKFDFDSQVERAGTWSIRWDRYGRDVIPLWVADSDFRPPPAVLEAMTRRLDHGILGYTAPPEALREAIVSRLERLYRWRIEPSWIVFLSGVVPGLYLAARRLLRPDGHALVPRPIYQHLKRACEFAQRAHTEVPLVLDRGRWVFDESSLRRRADMLLFCNPQNPGGTVFRAGELERIAALTGDALIVSDEIHCDIVLEKGLRHVPIASLSPEISRRTVTLMSPNKAFNFPSAGCAWAIIEDAELRKNFAEELNAHVLPACSVFGYEASLAAYTGNGGEGDEWLAAQAEYLRGNRELVESTLGLPMAHVEATYLAWIDCSGIKSADASALFLKHGVALSPGSQFGDARFARMNFGTQRARLREALARMRAAIAAA